MRSIIAELANVDDGGCANRSQTTVDFPNLQKLVLPTPALRHISFEELLDFSHLDCVVHRGNDITVPTLFGLEDNESLPAQSVETVLSFLRSQPRYEGFRLPRPRAAGFAAPVFALAPPRAAGLAFGLDFAAPLVAVGAPPPRL